MSFVSLSWSQKKTIMFKFPHNYWPVTNRYRRQNGLTFMGWTLGKVWDSICYVLGQNTFLPQCLSNFTQSQKVGLQWILREAWWKVGLQWFWGKPGEKLGLGGGEVQCTLSMGYNVALQSCNKLASCSERGGGTKRPCCFLLSMETRISSSQMSLLALVHTT